MILLIVSFVFFILAALKIPESYVNYTGAGLAFYIASLLFKL